MDYWFNGSELRRRAQVALVIVGLIMLGLAIYGSILEGIGNLAINVGVEGLVTLTAIAVIGPLVRNTQEGPFRSYDKLNYERFIAQAAQAREKVQIFTTFTPLLQERSKYSQEFLKVLHRLVANGVDIEVMLLHPDSLTVPQRQREVARAGSGFSVRDGILDNIRVLGGFIAKLDSKQASRVAVRIYDAGASIIMHRWDDRSLVSFLPPDRLAEEGKHMEIPMRSEFGAFVQSRPQELWQHEITIDLDDYLQMQVAILDGGVSQDPVRARFVGVDGLRYAVSAEIVAAQAVHRDHTLQVIAPGQGTYDVEVVNPVDVELCERLMLAFLEKYGHRPDQRVVTFVRLTPAVHAQAA